MRIKAALLVAALVMASVGVKAADLVVWWEKGFNAEEDAAVKEIVAAFEQKTGKQVELVLEKWEHLRDDTLAAIEAGRPLPTSSSPSSPSSTTSSGPTRAGSSSSRTRSDR